MRQRDGLSARRAAPSTGPRREVQRDEEAGDQAQGQSTSNQESGVKISITREQMQDGLGAVASAVPTRTVMPALAMAKLEASDGRLTLSASDLDTTVSLSVPCEVTEPGEVCAPAKRLLEIAKNAGPAPLTILSKGEGVQVQAGRARFSLPALSADEFPSPPALPYGSDHVVRGSDLFTLFAQTGFVASTEETQPILNGVLWEIREGSMSMVATNGHRLAKMAVAVPVPAGVGGDPEEGRDVIVHPKALTQARSIFGDDDEIEVAFSDNHISLRTDSARVISRIIEGPYPNYSQVIPDGNDKTLTIHRESLLAAVRRVRIMASDQTNRMRWSLSGDGLQLFAQTPDAGEGSDEVAAEYEGEPMDIGFNAAYVEELLRRLPSEEVRITFKAPERPAVIHPVDGPDLINLVMPLRLLD